MHSSRISWAEAGAQKVGSLDRMVTDNAAQVLLNDIGLALLDTDKAVGDLHSIADFVGVLVDKVKLGRVAEPGGDERRGRRGAGPLPQTRRDQCPKRRISGEARCDRIFILRGDPSNEALPKRVTRDAHPTRTMIVAMYLPHMSAQERR
jgi:hypothetical protein